MTSRQSSDGLASRQTRRKALWLSALLALALAAPAFAQNAPANRNRGAATGTLTQDPPPRWPMRDRNKGISLVISPQAEARPALEYSLLPRAWERQQGNAAVKYLAATSAMPKIKEDEQDLLDAARRDAPLAELNENEKAFKDLASSFNIALRMIADGARMDSVDWETQVREQGVNYFLPSLGSFRQAANVLALEIRFAIKRHDWTAARQKLATGYALARHMDQGDTLIEALIGNAIVGLMNTTLEDWVAEPGAPNLYWDLINLPSPFIDVRNALDFESSLADFSLPALKDMRKGNYSAENWTQLWQQVTAMGASIGNESNGPRHDNGALAQTASAAMGTLLYPEGKQYLIAHGMAPDAVEKMPVAEVLGRYFVSSFDDTRDEIFKWTNLPVPVGTKGAEAAERAFQKINIVPGTANQLASILLPALSGARLVIARQDRQIAAMAIVEALRAYAAANGKFPANLTDLTLPVPKDPTTAQAFQYELRDGKALLSSPAATPNANNAMRIEISLRK